MTATNILTEAVADLAADSPLSYAELAELNRGRGLAARLAEMSPRERIGAAAVLAEATGRELSKVLELFARLMDGAPVAPPPAAAPARPARALVPSESTAGLFYIVTRESCTCPGFRFRKSCKHVRRAREDWAARVRAVLTRRQLAAAA